MWGSALAEFGRDRWCSIHYTSFSLNFYLRQFGIVFPKKNPKNCSQNFQVLRLQAIITLQWLQTAGNAPPKWSLYGMSSSIFTIRINSVFHQNCMFRRRKVLTQIFRNVRGLILRIQNNNTPQSWCSPNIKTEQWIMHISFKLVVLISHIYWLTILKKSFTYLLHFMKAKRPYKSLYTTCLNWSERYIEEKQTELETENKNTADNAGITQTQTRDTRYRLMHQ